MSDYEAARGAEREKTARLRKLRLAKEAADEAAAAIEAAKPKPAGKKKRREAARRGGDGMFVTIFQSPCHYKGEPVVAGDDRT